ncbi:VWA domain-containing protein [Nocardioides sp. HDW12B]|uniref:vWA domain-containing protein n=1 Tax=Nocardioides sp. HDW12B TaxID=2714939 RepID=UPI00140E420A|nr:VWA domain-containing protein [Nocardioides sp. HDW12B]QIK66618.1 VWA domain-containing protein [Nocardioides sp. HDW12B]
MTLLDRHLAFVRALRTAGLPVSLAEDLDSVRAMTDLGLADRETLRAGLAATLLKRENHRPSFDALFDLHYPALLGSGVSLTPEVSTDPTSEDRGDAQTSSATSAAEREARLAELRGDLVEAMASDDAAALQALAVRGVEQFGAMPGRGQGLSQWSSYNTMRAVSPDTLVLRLARALAAEQGEDPGLRTTTATRRVDAWRRRVETEVRRRIAEDKGAEHVARTTLRPTIDQLAFTSARRDDIAEMRRQIGPLARRLATRLAKEQHARRRGPLDVRRTVRASLATGGVPITTHHRPKRPHRSELVVLCDVSGSVANFASFTLLLVYALREQFTKVRAFTFVDDLHEVTGEFTPGADPEEVLTRLADSARHASMWGRTDYGRAFGLFQERHADALTPKSGLLVLGDGRSNYTDPGLHHLRQMTAAARHAWWLNPEHTRQWGTGDSAAPEYAEVVAMAECRNLAQLTEIVHDIV